MEAQYRRFSLAPASAGASIDTCRGEPLEEGRLRSLSGAVSGRRYAGGRLFLQGNFLSYTLFDTLRGGLTSYRLWRKEGISLVGNSFFSLTLVKSHLSAVSSTLKLYSCFASQKNSSAGRRPLSLWKKPSF